MILVSPLGPEKEWFGDLLVFLLEEAFALPVLWNLLVWPYFRKFHTGLESLCLYTWRLSDFQMFVVVTLGLRIFITPLYQGKWSRASIGVLEGMQCHGSADSRVVLVSAKGAEAVGFCKKGL